MIAIIITIIIIIFKKLGLKVREIRGGGGTTKKRLDKIVISICYFTICSKSRLQTHEYPSSNLQHIWDIISRAKGIKLSVYQISAAN